MNISEIIWKIFRSEPYHMDQQASQSCQEIIDSRLNYDKLVILLLLCTVASMPSSFISILLYGTVVNIQIELLRKKSQLDISGAKFKRILGLMVY